jgi:hypothetical protein
MNEDERTTPLGLFNYAHSYWVCAATLERARLDITHKDAPVDYLYYHAIELYLKSYLRLSGHSLRQLRDLGHGIVKLYDAAVTNGLDDAEQNRNTIGWIPSNYLRSRYIQTGAFRRAFPQALWQLCGVLHWEIEPLMNKATGVTRTRIIPDKREPD